MIAGIKFRSNAMIKYYKAWPRFDLIVKVTQIVDYMVVVPVFCLTSSECTVMSLVPHPASFRVLTKTPRCGLIESAVCWYTLHAGHSDEAQLQGAHIQLAGLLRPLRQPALRCHPSGHEVYRYTNYIFLHNSSFIQLFNHTSTSLTTGFDALLNRNCALNHILKRV